MFTLYCFIVYIINTCHCSSVIVSTSRLYLVHSHFLAPFVPHQNTLWGIVCSVNCFFSRLFLLLCIYFLVLLILPPCGLLFLPDYVFFGLLPAPRPDLIDIAGLTFSVWTFRTVNKNSFYLYLWILCIWVPSISHCNIYMVSNKPLKAFYTMSHIHTHTTSTNVVFYLFVLIIHTLTTSEIGVAGDRTINMCWPVSKNSISTFYI